MFLTLFEAVSFVCEALYMEKFTRCFRSKRVLIDAVFDDGHP